MRQWARKMLTLPSGDKRFDDCMDRFANIIISEALNFTDGNRSQAAKLRGLSWPTLHSKTEKFKNIRQIRSIVFDKTSLENVVPFSLNHHRSY
jgi:DNA-binding NtrC family response regulator